MHGGAVEAESAGRGGDREFTLRLPLAAEALAERDGHGRYRSPAAPPRRCLVIEDNVDAAESMSMLLQLTGHEADVALRRRRGGGEGARLPSRGGALRHRAARGPRRLRRGPRLPRRSRAAAAFLIALTGYGQEEDSRRALEAGFDNHLTKPADLDALRRLLYNSPSSGGE